MGTKAATTAAARTALAAGHSVIIDRCNVTPPQRRDFIHMAQQYNFPMHAVFLDPPLKTAIARAAGRVDHEGGVTGNKAPRVVSMMNSELKKHREELLDALVQEGVQSCLVCGKGEGRRRGEGRRGEQVMCLFYVQVQMQS